MSGEVRNQMSAAHEVTDSRPPAAWVIGAGSGVGAALVHELHRRGYAVALSGRRADRLEQTLREVQAAGAAPGSGRLVPHPLDVTDATAMEAVHAAIVADIGEVEVLVFAAGLNTPRRYWADMDPVESQQVYATNLIAPTTATSLVLPGMRGIGKGTLIYVSSLSAWQHAPDAGVVYSASKKGMSTLPEHINSTEGRSGIRATAVVPGDIDSEFLEMRPNVPGAEARKTMLTPKDVAAAVGMVIDQPRHVCVNELVISPVR
ncbi:SDR family oxidoreductase [Tessaracoccus rhinocerotis]|nr:SDR family oxidoreductase [Tessaracoccus rhinocerotis]